MHGGVEGHAAPGRHLLKPAELPNGGDHAPGEQADVRDGGASQRSKESAGTDPSRTPARNG
jgi:hypothetical protein